MKTKGFTLVELLVVIAILAILATVSVVGFTSFLENAKNSNAQTELHQVETYIEADMLADGVFTISATERLYYNSTTKTVEYQTLSEKTWTAEAAETDITNSIKAIADFADLKGTIKVTGNKLAYTRTEGGSATATID